MEFARSLPGHSERHGTNHSKRRWPSSTKGCGSTGGSGDQDRSAEAVTQSGELREFVRVGCAYLGSQSANEYSSLELVILSTLPTKTDEELRARRDWYGLRWPIAEDHQAEKTGCSEEDDAFAKFGVVVGGCGSSGSVASNGSRVAG